MNGLRIAARCAAAMLAAAAAASASAQAVDEAQAKVAHRDCEKLEYPQAALRAGARGISVIEFHVDATGTVTRAEVVRSAGRTREHRLLDQAAKSGLSICQFTPAKDADGHPVASVVTIPYRWLID
ncbi:MAG TPA: energy transducer TonB [Burkholderiaceae bacterium]